MKCQRKPLWLIYAIKVKRIGKKMYHCGLTDEALHREVFLLSWWEKLNQIII